MQHQEVHVKKKMKAEGRLFPPSSGPEFQMFSPTLGARFSKPPARYLLSCSDGSPRARCVVETRPGLLQVLVGGAKGWTRTLSPHFICKASPCVSAEQQAQSAAASATPKPRTALAPPGSGLSAAPSWSSLHPMLCTLSSPNPTFLGQELPRGIRENRIFFFSLSVTSSHLTFLRNEGCRQILKVFWHLKTRLGNQAFQRQPDCIFRH